MKQRRLQPRRERLWQHQEELLDEKRQIERQQYNNAAAIDTRQSHLGFELEWAYAFGDGWRIDAGVGYTDPEYKKLRNDVQGLTVDSDFVLISEWNVSASL